MEGGARKRRGVARARQTARPAQCAPEGEDRRGPGGQPSVSLAAAVLCGRPEACKKAPSPAPFNAQEAAAGAAARPWLGAEARGDKIKKGRREDAHGTGEERAYPPEDWASPPEEYRARGALCVPRGENAATGPVQAVVV